MMGADSLVPPNCDHEEFFAFVGAYTLRPPVLGSAAAETSAMARLAHPVTAVVWKPGCAITVEQPEPAPLQAVSETRVLPDIFNEVPPTAVTKAEDAGYDPPLNPASPVDAVIAMPGWL